MIRSVPSNRAGSNDKADIRFMNAGSKTNEPKNPWYLLGISSSEPGQHSNPDVACKFVHIETDSFISDAFRNLDTIRCPST